MRNTQLSRRRFLGAASLTTAAAAIPQWVRGQDDKPSTGRLVAGIERTIIFNGRKTGTTWFHPRACMIPTSEGVRALMTLQSISGSDVFGHVHWTTSNDLGKTWTTPRPIPGFGRRPLADGFQEGVCDVVPEYHGPTRLVLAVGHNVYYKSGRLARPQRSRWPMYVVKSPTGDWSKAQRLTWDDPRGGAIYTCGCAQRITLDNVDVLIPLSFGPKGRKYRSVTTVLCSFDGKKLRIREVGNELMNSAGRGLLEPSLALLAGRFYMTIRAEDGRGYVTVSGDGLHWKTQQPWQWDDGGPLTMSTTQQRWLVHSDGLFLVYTRKAEKNVNVFRWRAPLFLAEVDRKSLRLIRASERVVLPLIGDGLKDPKHVARMGNFHTVAATPHESWVTTGETLPHDGWAGDTLLARIRWKRPNGLAPQRD